MTMGKALLALMVVLSGFISPWARAQLDPELDKPYRIQVVLHVADNRFLTPIFQEQLQAELRDRLQLSLGALAQVDVVTTHPLLAEIEAKGLDNGLNGWEQITSAQTHFVLVDFKGGVYELQARGYDGMTGLLSSDVQVARTGDRTQVAHSAVTLIEQEFSLVGTVVGVTGADVQVAIKGGKLSGSLERRLKPSQVLAISRITREGDRLHGRRVPWALLEVKDGPRAGICRCRLWHRFQQDDLGDYADVATYRCLTIATSPGPLKLRLVDEEQLRPLVGLQVHVLRSDGTKAAELTTNQSGLLVTRERYENFVLVRVLSGDSVRAQFPVVMHGDRTVLCRLKFSAEAEALAPLEFRRDQWVRRILDNLRLASERETVLNSELGVHGPRMAAAGNGARSNHATGQ
jgi:hypothetical protein